MLVTLQKAAYQHSTQSDIRRDLHKKMIIQQASKKRRRKQFLIPQCSQYGEWLDLLTSLS